MLLLYHPQTPYIMITTTAVLKALPTGFPSSPFPEHPTEGEEAVAAGRRIWAPASASRLASPLVCPARGNHWGSVSKYSRRAL